MNLTLSGSSRRKEACPELVGGAHSTPTRSPGKRSEPRDLGCYVRLVGSWPQFACISRWRPPLRVVSIVQVALLLLAAPTRASTATLPGYTSVVPAETSKARELRHARVAERRSGVILLAHRGASTLATENTLAAYAAAMDYGADGCEIDVRRCRDGVLALFHDDMLDRLTDGFGKVEDLTYPELLALQPQLRVGRATQRTRPPTFAALLVLARQRAMLLHLDVKEPGLDDVMAGVLDETDMWDHVVAVNTETLPKLLGHPKLKLLRYKGGLYEARQDLDPVAVQQALAKPGQMLILEDPRLAVQQLKRNPYGPVALPAAVFAFWKPVAPPDPQAGTNFVPVDYLRRLQTRIRPDAFDALLELLRPDDLVARRLPSPDAAAERRRTERIVERAWAAERLGQLSRRSPRLIELLEAQVQQPSLHPNWIYNGLDAHTAARALGRLQVVAAVPILVERFRRVDPGLIRVQNPEWTNNPIAWVDWRKMSILPVLGELRTPASKQFLLEYVGLSETAARQLSVPQFDVATGALFRHPLQREELLGLLRSTNSAVRGTAILVCIDHPTRERSAALREAAPWALSLPPARH